jgi:transposase-like protein
MQNTNLATITRPYDPEVTPGKKKRYHTVSYKLKILKELDECLVKGGKGAILRREGLYSSTVTGWRKQKAAGKLEPGNSKSNKDKIYELEKENRKLKQELKQAKMIIEVQKKISELLEQKD